MATTSRLAFLAATALIALSAGLALPAQAQNTGNFDMNNVNAPGPVITLVQAITNTPPVIVSLQGIFGGSDSASACADDTGSACTFTDGSNVINYNVTANDATYNTDGNLISTSARGNNANNSVGTANTDGAVILSGQQVVPDGALVASVAATTNDSLILQLLAGSGTNVTATANENRVQASASFNTNFSTIDTDVPNGLDGIAGSYLSPTGLGGAGTATYFPTEVDQIANFNVASVQVNQGFTNGNDANLPTASVDDTAVVLAFLVDPAIDPLEVSGSYGLNGNVVSAQTLGNAADNSVFLFAGESSTFDGSAFVSATQSSSDSTDPAGDFPGISAGNEDTTIAAGFAAETQPVGPPPPLPPVTFGPPDIVAGVDLDVTVDGNAIASAATINSSRNEIGLESGLALSGTTLIPGVGVGAGTNAAAGETAVAADYAVITNQTAASGNVLTGGAGGQLTGGADPQSAVAYTDDALIVLAIEDVDADSALSVAGNSITSNASGQVATHLIRNHGDVTSEVDLGEDASAVSGAFASVVRQLLVHPDVDASVSGSTIWVNIGADEDDDITFGGLAGSSLVVGDSDLTDGVASGNLIRAQATGNGATALVDLIALTMTSDSQDGGALISTANNQGLANFTVQDAEAGLMLVNWQAMNLAGDDDTGSVNAELDDVAIDVLINYKDGVVSNTDAIEIADASIAVDGNQAVASASLNSYTGTANIATDTSYDGSIAALSHQLTTGADDSQYLANSEITGANVNVNLGITGEATEITASVSGNSMLSLTNGNDSTQAIAVAGGTTVTVAGVVTGDGNNAQFNDNITDGTSETRVTSLDATGGIVAVSDQTLRATAAESRIEDVEIELVLAAPAAGDNSLAESTLTLANNSLISQVLGNSAKNSVTVTASTSISVTGEEGAIAGIVSSQSSVAQIEGTSTPNLNSETFYEAEILDTSIHADVMVDGLTASTSGTTLAVTGNTLQALTYANSVSNVLSASAPSINGTSSEGVILSAATFGEEMQPTIEGAGLYIMNRQRNEANNTASGLGPSVSSFFAGNEVTAVLSGGATGVSNSTLDLNRNTLQGVAAANVAGNTINVNNGTTPTGLTTDASAGILNRQGNSGSVEVDVDGGNLITGTLLGTTAHDTVTLNANNNAIGGVATGNLATNAIVAKAATSLNGTNEAGNGGAFIGEGASNPGGTVAAVHTNSGTPDSNPDSFANGNYSILNTQLNYGVAGDGDVPSLINSEVEGSTIALTVPGGAVTTTNSTLSLSGNQVSSQAGANQAVNSISTTASTGGPAYASVLNNQGVSLTNATSAVTDTILALNVEGTATGSSTAANNNSVVASASLNSASNSITSQTTVGSLPGATIVNYQTSSGSSVSASNSGTTIANNAGLSGGTFSGGNASVSGNQIGSSATINNATNTTGAAGQTFTRTSSF